MKKQITVITDPLTISSSPIRESLGLRACQQIDAGNINQKKGKNVDRITDTYSLCPREFRKCFGVKMNGKIYPLVSVDYSTFYPYLVHTEYNTLYDSELEKAKYLEALECDIYNFLKPEGMDRDVAKKQLTTFLSGGRKISNKMSRSFKSHFPMLHERIVTIDDLAERLQNLEASIVIGEVARMCVDRGIWVTTKHDNVATIPEHVATVHQMMIDVCVNRFGVPPRCKVEDGYLNGEKQTYEYVNQD
jgi:hypothetical protein